jgi:hypothetical protein
LGLDGRQSWYNDSTVSADDRIREAIGLFLKRAHQDIDAQFPRITADVTAAIKVERQAWRDQHVGAFVRLAEAIRQLDDADSLSGVLKALSKGAMTEATRVALLLVEPEALRIWGHVGFADTPAPGDFTLGRGGPFDAAIAQKTPVPVPSSGPDASRPSFMRMPADHSGLVVPLVVGGNVVALLYADGLERRPEIEEAPIWTELVEVLVRHAALRLENVTSLRTVEVLTRTA